MSQMRRRPISGLVLATSGLIVATSRVVREKSEAFLWRVGACRGAGSAIGLVILVSGREVVTQSVEGFELRSSIPGSSPVSDML